MSDIVLTRPLTPAGSLLFARTMPGGLRPDGGSTACAARGGATTDATHKGSTARRGHRRGIRFMNNALTLSSDFRA